VQPGDTLEVRILEIDLAVDYGHNRQRPYAGALPDEVPGVFQRIIPIDRKAKATHVAPGVVVPVDRPFFRSGTLIAAQGQGEIDLSAIETSNRGKFQFILRKDLKLTWPRAETLTHWMVMGLNPNLEEAMKIAVRETILFLTQRFPGCRARRPI